MRKIVMVLISVLCCAAITHATTIKKPRTGAMAAMNPTNTCDTAQLINIGETVGGELSTLGDLDYYAINIVAGQALLIETVMDGTLEDSEMYLYDEFCNTVLAYSDDSVDLESAIIYRADVTGTFKIMVMGYDNDEYGTYGLRTSFIELTEVGESCATATPIPNGDFSFTATTLGLSDFMAFPVDNSYGSGAPDAFFVFRLQPGASFSCELEILGADFVLYLIDGCAAPLSDWDYFSDDDPESLYYVNSTLDSQNVFLVIDGYDEFESGGFVLTGHNDGQGVIANQETTWGSMKALYR